MTEYMDYPHTDLDSPLGRVRVWSTGRDHLALRTLDDEYDHPVMGVLTKLEPTRVTIRSIEYRVRLDLHLNAAEDAYEVGTDEYGRSRAWTALLMDREGFEKASEPARRKALEVLVPWLNEFAKTLSGYDMLIDAEMADLNNRLFRLEKEHAEAVEAEKTLKVEMNSLRRAMSTLRMEAV